MKNKEYSFTKEEKEFIKKFQFKFEVNKDMTEDELFFVIETLGDFIQTEGIEDDMENEQGKIAGDILTRMAHEDM